MHQAVIFLSSARQPWAISSSDEFFGGFLWLVDCDTCTLYLPTLSILSLAVFSCFFMFTAHKKRKEKKASSIVDQLTQLQFKKQWF